MFLVINDSGYFTIEYGRVSSRILYHIRQLEKEWINIVCNLYSSSIISNSPIVSEGEFNYLVQRSELIEKQENYAITFFVVAYKLYRSDHIDKIE